MNAITLLDGGMGQELVTRSGDAPTPLWSTQVMIDHPGLVAQIHGDYFAAGATIATANTYALHRDRLIRAGIEDRMATLHADALSEAAQARDAHGSGRIAGAIGPLGASYRTDLHPDDARATALFAEIAGLLAPSCDLLIFETVASLAQVRSAMSVPCDIPVWLALTVDDCDGTRFRSGEPLADVLPHVAGASALLINCSAPEAMPAALETIARAGLPYGAYANAFTGITADFLRDDSTVDALSPRRDLGPEAYADHVMGWVGQGATIVGGCCETGPAHIAAIARRLIAAGHQIV